ncbi:YhcH/YjgK/YiaL family protein [Neobacillus drentensis]|uniref:YhcH/YjgK/YiaL family protein n=1 Tax=Neobacillus drentensis TaxID=220684 RepID=UPI00285CFE99|nr:YhcH/YjgK/YiaL family protein [Neobacillus drentensis]MDR7237666.1 YhcH/YjgK/YiaL family protein [Neobacillus drentensis]
MIIDKLSNAKLYYGVHPRIQKGLEYLIEHDLNSMAPGKYEIDGLHLYVLIEEYETMPKEQGRWESHRKYADIQYMISGQESMGYSTIEGMNLIERHEEKDHFYFEGSGDLLLVKQGSFAIFLPKEAHMPQISDSTPQSIKKAVVKILID